MDAAARAAASTLASAATPDANGEKLRRRLCQELDSMEREQPLRGTPHYRGHIGGRLAGHIGSNRFVVRTGVLQTRGQRSPAFQAGVATDGRAKCSESTCRLRLVPGTPRLGKVPPSLRCAFQKVRSASHETRRHGHNLKTKWYHIDCIFINFTRASRKSKTITAMEDVEGARPRGSDRGRARPNARRRVAPSTEGRP